MRLRADWRKGLAVHHIDGDPRNNAIENLRLVDLPENAPFPLACPQCGGKGFTEAAEVAAQITDRPVATCPTCAGTGRRVYK